MSSYYYFIATLPYVQVNFSEPPIKTSVFLSQAEQFLSKKDMALLSIASLQIANTNSATVFGSELLTRYYAWERGFRNELARLRGLKLQIPAEKYYREGSTEPDSIKSAQLVFQASDPLQAELMAEKERWSFIEMLSSTKYFELEYLIAYALFIQILERKAGFIIEYGKEAYQNVYNSILEFGEKYDKH